MLHNLVKSDKIIKPSWITNLGTLNSLPEPFEEVTESDFIHNRTRTCIQSIEFRSILFPNGFYSTYIEWHPSCAFAQVFPKEWCLKDSKVFYTMPIRYFRIGCKHSYRPMTKEELNKNSIVLFHSTHAAICDQCGDIQITDSSD